MNSSLKPVTKKIHLLDDSLYYSDWYVENCLLTNTEHQNIYICVTKDGSNITNKHTTLLSPDSAELHDLIQEINTSNKITTVIFHYLDYTKARIINAITNKNVKIVWIIWSGDLYSLDKLKFKKYDPYAARYINRQDPLNNLSFKQVLGRLKLKYWDRIDLDGKEVKKIIYKAIQRINACVTLVEQEALEIRSKLNPRIYHIPFVLVNASNQSLSITPVEKNKVLIGHSADPTNNHWEVLKSIRLFKIKDDVIMPLSYGESMYADELLTDIEKLNLLFKIRPILELLPKDEYHKLLSTVKVGIFGQNIQQGFGNIITLLFFGAKIFLKERNPLYNHFVKNGIKVFSIEKDLTEHELSTPLEVITAKKNADLLNQHFSQDKVLEYYKNLLSE